MSKGAKVAGLSLIKAHFDSVGDGCGWLETARSGRFVL